MDFFDHKYKGILKVEDQNFSIQEYHLSTERNVQPNGMPASTFNPLSIGIQMECDEEMIKNSFLFEWHLSGKQKNVKISIVGEEGLVHAWELEQTLLVSYHEKHDKTTLSLSFQMTSFKVKPRRIGKLSDNVLWDGPLMKFEGILLPIDGFELQTYQHRTNPWDTKVIAFNMNLITINLLPEESIYDWFSHNINQPKEISLQISSLSKQRLERKIDFSSAYLCEFKESFSHFSEKISTQIAISPEIIKLNDIILDRKWPQ